MKKSIAILLAAVCALSLAALLARKTIIKKKTEHLKVAIAVAEYVEWNRMYENAIRKECEELGWTCELFDAKQDASTQIDQINAIVAQDFDVLIIMAVDNASLAAVVGQAADAGMIVLDHYGFDDSLGINDKIYRLLFGQKESGILVAEEYIKRFGDTGKVAIIAGLTGADNAQKRTDGMQEVLAKHPGIELVATQFCDWDMQKAQAAAEDLITAHPDLKGFLVQDDTMAKGVWNAVEAAGKQGKIAIASEGFYQWSIPYVKEGKFAFTVSYTASSFAKEAVNIIRDVVAGKPVDRLQWVGMELVTVENVDTAAYE